MAGILKIGAQTQYGKIVAILWIGERYYAMLKNGVVSLMPANTVEALPTVRRKPPVQQPQPEICPHYQGDRIQTGENSYEVVPTCLCYGKLSGVR